MTDLRCRTAAGAEFDGRASIAGYRGDHIRIRSGSHLVTRSQVAAGFIPGPIISVINRAVCLSLELTNLDLKNPKFGLFFFFT